jgi:hypothetical protein
VASRNSVSYPKKKIKSGNVKEGGDVTNKTGRKLKSEASVILQQN